MLVDNKFFYISIPRCASTSFHYSCILHNLDIKFVTNYINEDNNKTDFTNIKKENLMDVIKHGHESLFDLQKKFGTGYPIISIKRNRHERFYSLFKQLIFDTHRIGAFEISNFLKNINVNELFFFKTKDLLNKQLRVNKINDFLLKNKLIKKRVELEDIRIDVGESIIDKEKKIDSYIVNIFEILITPVSFYHHHNKNIIWFNFENLNEIENWVSTKINKPFKLENTNSSKDIECNLKLNEEFKNIYNITYDYFDIVKENNTII
jgi:hypothetical protein